ncbi:hypothetical protein EPI10_022958 [Gossypium australe]|uniref:Uncharacterized protein n=1 Tax=Gossypium australe TaxID=47621 RepID=A0A5B6VTG3_9ROSI|nr:hypothetical protein EPI10_022958 [Gossypium australe]
MEETLQVEREWCSWLSLFSKIQFGPTYEARVRKYTFIYLEKYIGCERSSIVWTLLEGGDWQRHQN